MQAAVVQAPMLAATSNRRFFLTVPLSPVAMQLQVWGEGGMEDVSAQVGGKGTG